MRVREKIEAVHVFLLIAGCALLGGFIFFSVYFLRSDKYSTDLDYSLESVDAFIKAGNYAEAAEIIEGMQADPGYRGDWLRLLKRCRILAETSGQSGIFSDFAVRAQAAYPDDEEIAAVTAAALIDAGKIDEAAPLAGKLDSIDFRSFAAEIHVRAGTFPEGEARGELVYAMLPASKNYFDFITAGELSGEQGFFLNAALLLLEAGRREEALRILYKPETGNAYPYLTALASYDAENYEEAERYWDLLDPEEKMLPLSLQLRADTFLRRRKYDDAENVCGIFLLNYPGHSPVPYLTMNFLQHRKIPIITPVTGGNVLERGLSFFPRDSRLMLDSAKALVAGGKKQEGVQIADRVFSGMSAGDTQTGDEGKHAAADSRVLVLAAQMGDIPQGRIVSELWMLRNEYPAAPSVPALLRWHLFSQNDFSAIRMLLSPSAESEPFSLSYLAALDFAEGGLTDAAGKLEREISRFPACPESHYNLGLVYLKMKEYPEALTSFEKATACMEFAETAALGEQTVFRTFDTHILLGNFTNATRIIREFLEKNPSHPQALQKLRKLEARRE